jgi:hypothetical protein
MKHDDDKKPAYTPPTLTVLGTTAALTLGPSGGTNSDGLFPHHTSG